MRKAALLGSASSSLNQAPFNEESWEIWALGPEERRVTRYYEMHPDSMVKTELRERYKTSPVVFSLHPLADVPAAYQYPLEQVVSIIGRDYFASSIGYMLGHLIYEHLMAKTPDQKFSEVAIFGVDMLLDEEYAMQRPNCEYLLGICKGLGINVIVPETSALLKVNTPYGRGTPIEEGPISEKYLTTQIESYRSLLHKAMIEVHKIEGAMFNSQCNLDYLKNYKRGGVIPGQKGE